MSHIRVMGIEGVEMNERGYFVGGWMGVANGVVLTHECFSVIESFLYWVGKSSSHASVPQDLKRVVVNMLILQRMLSLTNL